MRKIGPTFGPELAAAGLVGLPMSWHSDGTFSGRENLTSEQGATFDAVLARHDPSKDLPQDRRESEKIVESLIAEGIIPASKRAAILDRLK